MGSGSVPTSRPVRTLSPRSLGCDSLERVIREAPSDRWSRQAIDAMAGCPQELVPGQGREIPSFVRPELRRGERAGPPAAAVPTIPVEIEVRPMYVRKAEVATYGDFQHTSKYAEN